MTMTPVRIYLRFKTRNQRFLRTYRVTSIGAAIDFARAEFGGLVATYPGAKLVIKPLGALA